MEPSFVSINPNVALFSRFTEFVVPVYQQVPKCFRLLSGLAERLTAEAKLNPAKW